MTMQLNETETITVGACNKMCQDASAACLATFCGIALLANTYVLISAFWLKNKSTVNLRLCISLAAADCWCALTQAVYTVVFTFVPVSAVNTAFRCSIGVLDRIRQGSMFTSIFHLLLISLNHLVGTRWPLQHRYWVTVGRCNVLIIALWLIPPLAYIIAARITMWGALQYPCTNTDTINPYFLIPTVINVWVPCCLTVSIYGYILCTIHKQRFNNGTNEKYVAEQERSATCTTPMLRKHNAKTSSIGLGGISSAARVSSSRQAIVTTLLITLTFVLCWVPNTMSYVAFSKNNWDYIQSNGSVALIDDRVRVGVSLFTYTLVIVKLFLNAVIYALRIAELREAMLNMRKHLTRLVRHNILQQRENSTKFSRLTSGLPSVFEEGTDGKLRRAPSSLQIQKILMRNAGGSATSLGDPGQEDKPVIETAFSSYHSSETFLSPSGDSNYQLFLPAVSLEHMPASERRFKNPPTNKLESTVLENRMLSTLQS